MIRKMISILFAITMFFSMTAAVMADSFQINTDKNVVSTGETMTVSIALDETMYGEFRNLQGQLSYDTVLLMYVSHRSSDKYSDYTFADMADRNYFTFSNTDFTDDGFSTISKGTVASIEFKVKDGVTEEHLKTALMLNVNVQDIKGNSEELASSISILICGQSHEKSNDSESNNKNKASDEAVCENCGEEYIIDEDASTRSIDDDIDDGIKEGDDQNNGLLIAAIITALAVVCVFIAYRRKYRE